MSFNLNWNIDQYREEHESEDHWQLRRDFMVKWKNDFCEERLVCLARVFANIELLGCRYPIEVMQEVARLSHEVAQKYRTSRKNKLRRTFVSASDAAEDRARGVKREGGVVIDALPAKASKISFVRPGHKSDDDAPEGRQIDLGSTDTEPTVTNPPLQAAQPESNTSRLVTPVCDYFKEMQDVQCADVRCFNEGMFQTKYGRMVLLVRPWTNRLSNIQTTCQVCRVPLELPYEGRLYSVVVNQQLVAQATGDTKLEARDRAEVLAWSRLKQEAVSVVFKQQWLAQGGRISVSDVAGAGRADAFGTPVDTGVAAKMMKMMGWTGGGLGVDAQGIAEPIKPHLQMVNRAGLGSNTNIRDMKRSALALMQRYIASDALDVDLVFSSDFGKEERAQLHQLAKRAGLASRSYGAGDDRFLVVKKKMDPFSLVRAIIEKGGNTPKYQVFIPEALCGRGR